MKLRDGVVNLLLLKQKLEALSVEVNRCTSAEEYDEALTLER